MEYGKVPGIEKPVSRLVQGTIMVGSFDLDYSFGLLDAVYEKGCNTFDTAHIYGGGDNERTVGQWVNERGIRDKVVLIGKGSHNNADRHRVTPYDIAADLFDSLARFKTDYIDLYILHRDDPSVPVGPIVDALNEHKQAGRINAFGGSNWSHDRVREANEYAAKHGLTPFAASSPHYSLAVQFKEPWGGCTSITGDANKDARSWYQETGLPLFVWSSVAAGFFSGRFTREQHGNPEDGYDQMCSHSYCYDENFDRLDRAQELASEKGVTPTQIAVAWVMSQPELNIFPLIGPRNVDEFNQNLEAMDLKLTPQEVAWLNLESNER